MALEVGRRRRRDVAAHHGGRALLERRLDAGAVLAGAILGDQLLDLDLELLAPLGIGERLDQLQAVHGVLGVGAEPAVGGGDLAVREAAGQRRAADQERRVDAHRRQVAGGEPPSAARS